MSNTMEDRLIRLGVNMDNLPVDDPHTRHLEMLRRCEERMEDLMMIHASMKEQHEIDMWFCASLADMVQKACSKDDERKPNRNDVGWFTCRSCGKDIYFPPAKGTVNWCPNCRYSKEDTLIGD